MKTILLHCLLLLPFTVLNIQANAQDPYTINHFTDQDGLPQNSVKAIAPDENGFLWLATENGLARFDGSRFLTFNSGNLSIQNSRIYYMCPSPGGNSVMARTIRNEVLLVRNGGIVVQPRPDHDFDYMSFKDVSDEYPITGLPNYYIYQSKSMHLLVPVGPRVYFKITADTIRLIADNKERYRITHPHLDAGHLFTLGARLCYMEKNGEFFLLDKEGAHTLRLTGDVLQQPRGSTAAQERVLYWNFAAGQVFVVIHNTCYRLQLSGTDTLHSSLVLQQFDFHRNGIHTLYHDSAHRRVFLGSVTKGLYVYSPKQFMSFKASGDEDEVYYAQAPFGKNGVVTPQGIAFDTTGKSRLLPLLSKLSEGDKYSMTRDQNGNYWYKHFTKVYGFNSDLTVKRCEFTLTTAVNQLYIDNQGRLWVGTWNGGLYTLQTNDPHPQLQLYTNRIKDISYMALDNQQQVLWTGTGNGLFRMDLASRRIDTIRYFNNRYVRSLLITAPDEVWVTTYSSGVYLYKNNHLVQLPLDQKKYIITAHCVVKDELGFLWITTNKGLFQCSYRDAVAYATGTHPNLYYLYYGKEQGFYTNEFNGGCQPCALKLQNGSISLPSLDGLVYFDPAKIRTELPDKQIFIDQVELDARVVSIDSARTLPHNFHHLRFSISTPYFGDPNNLHLYYSMTREGEEEPALWLQVTDNRMIEFSSMPSGQYTLRIRKPNGFGPGNMSEMIFVINVAKAFHETLWFRVLTGVLFFVIAFAISWLRVMRVQRKNRMLELRVQERTSELKETLETLQGSEQQLRRQAFIQQRLITAISHDLRTPLKHIMHVLSKGYRQQGDIEKEERSIIYESLYGMYHLVENLIQYMKSQFIEDDSFLEMTDLKGLLEEKADIFRPVSQSKEVTIENLTAPGAMALVNRQLLAIVVHNLLDNAVKYTRRGSIQLNAWCTAEKIHIRFKDTGIGMPPAISGWINQYEMGASVLDGKPASYNGIGLLMVMELLQLINGSITLDANSNEGATVHITLNMIN
ncbi:hypothetical protein F0L74_07220 [Chitinophaga agrisoli]|uniref:histidine kinase n=1 Tax=Chitinophaga agrisoli TaxID=2607653 RepID=A0A5B2W2Y0_9BACT|nr:sensor histidine kinase [Chitinophaga agrisoli]KAA2245735.1 hypothetical protein F0L74_07220 [Chitinophaga agrisoli]